MVRAGIVTGYGINADVELSTAFARVGADARRIHLADLIAEPEHLDRLRIVAFPGGFSFGDHLGSGLVFAARFSHHLKERFRRFLDSGGLVIGICNGFQILVKMGILPNLSGSGRPEVTLVHNVTGKLEDSWVRVVFDPESPCVWTRGIDEMDVPIRHGEGRFVAADRSVLDRLESKHLVAVRYHDRNPNGSQRNVAGITDLSGRILGLMPHPEAFLDPENHPRWRREAIREAAGLRLLRNGVEAAAHA